MNVGGTEVRDRPAPALGGGSGLTGGTRVIGSPAHQVGADAEACRSYGVGQADPGAGEGGLSGYQQYRSQKIGLALHLLVPHAAPARSKGGTGNVFEQKVGQFVRNGIGQPAITVHRIEDDESASAAEDRTSRKAAGVGDGELVNGCRVGPGGDEVSDGTDRDAVLVGEPTRIKSIVGAESEFLSDRLGQSVGLRREPSPHHGSTGSVFDPLVGESHGRLEDVVDGGNGVRVEVLIGSEEARHRLSWS